MRFSTTDPPRTAPFTPISLVIHKKRWKPEKTGDLPRTQKRTLHVQDVGLPRTLGGPSAYFNRTFRVRLNRKQEIQEQLENT